MCALRSRSWQARKFSTVPYLLSATTVSARRRVFGEYKSSEPSRFIDEVPAELVDRVLPSFSSTGYQSNFSHSHYTFKTNPYGRGGGNRVKEAAPAYAYEDEDRKAVESARVAAWDAYLGPIRGELDLRRPQQPDQPVHAGSRRDDLRPVGQLPGGGGLRPDRDGPGTRDPCTRMTAATG